MGVPLSNFITDLSLQRRVDTLIVLRYCNADEHRRIEQAMIKNNLLWWLNKVGFCLYVFMLYKGRLLERGNFYGISVGRAIMAFFIGHQFLWFGDYLASSIQWRDVKYIYYKYEPLIRNEVYYSSKSAVLDEELSPPRSISHS